MKKDSFMIFCVGADYYFPMDEIVGNQLLGQQMNGVVYGGVSLVPGIHGNAVLFNGIDGFVDYGHHDICLTNPGLCPNGITWSMWLYIQSTSYSYFVSSGCGFYNGDTGITSAGYLRFVARSTSYKWQYSNSPQLLL